MFFKHVGALFTQSIARFALNQPIDEVSRLDGPSPRDFVRVDLDLLGENVVTDLLPVLAMVGSFAKHAFVSYHAHGEVIDCNAVILSAHNLGCHVSRCPRSVLGILWVPQPCNS